MKQPRVLILYTGGTFGMELRTPDRASLPNLSAKLLKSRLLVHAPEIRRLAQCEVDIVLNRDSAHMGPSEWILIAEKIRQRWDDFDAVVVLHGTDTLAYCAAALSFLLRPCKKPVIMTGAQRPLTALRTDARNNLISAVEIAARGPRLAVNQVCVVFGDRLFQGNSVRKKSASDYAAFESPYILPIASIGTTIRYRGQITKHDPVRLKPVFNEKILMVHVTPGFPTALFNKALPTDLQGLVLVVFQSGTAPTHRKDFQDFLTTLRKRKIPIILATEGSAQPPRGGAQRIEYSASVGLSQPGIYWAGEMTPECAYVKTSLILGQPHGLRDFSRLWKADLAGEDSGQIRRKYRGKTRL